MLTTEQTLDLHHSIQSHLIEIERLFVSPKITIIVRAPRLADGDVILSNDDLELAIAAIRNLQSRDPAVKP